MSRAIGRRRRGDDLSSLSMADLLSPVDVDEPACRAVGAGELARGGWSWRWRRRRRCCRSRRRRCRRAWDGPGDGEDPLALGVDFDEADGVDVVGGGAEGAGGADGVVEAFPADALDLRPAVSAPGTARPVASVAMRALRKRTAPAAAGSGRNCGWCSAQMRWVSWVRAGMAVLSSPGSRRRGGEAVFRRRARLALFGEAAGGGGGLALLRRPGGRR